MGLHPRTDDPEPVEYEHWEFYVASQGSFSRDESMMTAPHVEINNYGILPNVLPSSSVFPKFRRPCP